MFWRYAFVIATMILTAGSAITVKIHEASMMTDRHLKEQARKVN